MIADIYDTIISSAWTEEEKKEFKAVIWLIVHLSH